MIRLFGPMPGTYTGPYPTESEARAALSNAEALDVAALAQDRAALASGTIRLDAAVGEGLLMTTRWWFILDSPDELAGLEEVCGPVTATTCQGCLVLRIPTEFPEPDASLASAVIVLIDPAVGRPFGYYGEGPRSSFPPVGWRK